MSEFFGQHHSQCPRRPTDVKKGNKNVNESINGSGDLRPTRPIGLDAVGGLDEHIKVIRNSIIYPLQHPGELQEWGVEPPKGIMFYGPPGTGKTLLAKALATELGTILGKPINFISHKGTDSLSMWFGEGERNLRELFKEAKKNKPSVIFFDEIDGLCPSRSSESMHGSQAYASVVTALLGLIDSVKRGEVFIIGGTNRLDAIDPAIRRPGRFDKELYFALPNEEDRARILQIHSSNFLQDKPSPSLLSNIASHTQGFSGADLEKLCTNTLHAAMARCKKTKPTLLCPCDINVLEEDWTTAFVSMNRSPSNIFGSTLYITELLSPTLFPLIHIQLEKILTALSPLLPTTITAGGYLSYLKANGRDISGNNFLFWDKESDSELFLNQLMKAVLSHASINEIPTYILDEAVIDRRMNVEMGSTIEEITEKIIGQVEGSTKPCILYAPNLNKTMDHIKKFTGEKSVSGLWKQLDRIKGSDHLLLATLIETTTETTSEEFQALFRPDGIYQVSQPSNEELRHFFWQIFCWENHPEMETLFHKTVRITEGNSLNDILGLFGSLYANKECQQSFQERLNLHKKTIKDYQERA